MRASNSVIAGDYKGCNLHEFYDGIAIITSSWNNIEIMARIDKDSVESFEVLSEERNRSAGNVVARGLVGAALLGPVGLAAGVLSSRKKGTHQIAIQFKNGKKSLVEVDDKFAKKINITLF